MAENSKIEWTDHTFNPWIGCTKVSAACDHCYAEVSTPTRTLRASGAETWGPHAPRKRTSAANWKKPLAWNRQALADGRSYRVFCASLADVFDNHRSILPEWRDDLWRLIHATPYLDWLLLTKRPQNVPRIVPGWMEPRSWPSNVWLGTTVENQTEADRRIPYLLAVPAAVRFLSVEPLLGPVDLRRWMASAKVTCKACKHSFWLHDANPCDHAESGAWTLACPNCGDCRCKPGWTPADARHVQMEPPADWVDRSVGRFDKVHPTINLMPMIDWVIVGGESGPGARPMHPDWARSLRDQCNAAGVPFFFKQWGEWAPLDSSADRKDLVKPHTQRAQWHHACGLILDTPRNEDALTFFSEGQVFRTGKRAAGRKLDGRTWDEMPEVPHA